MTCSHRYLPVSNSYSSVKSSVQCGKWLLGPPVLRLSSQMVSCSGACWLITVRFAATLSYSAKSAAATVRSKILRLKESNKVRTEQLEGASKQVTSC